MNASQLTFLGTKPRYSTPALLLVFLLTFFCCFLQNLGLLQNLFMGVLQDHANARQSYYPDDPVGFFLQYCGNSADLERQAFISQQIQESPGFVKGVERLRIDFEALSRLLGKFSVPFYSPRYAGHMNFDTSMPAILGYLMTTLYNPNNVAFEASPITTKLGFLVYILPF